MTWHPLERAALATALHRAGPGAPTLCEGWRSEHLAAHVVLRERAPATAAGVVVPSLAERTERLTLERGDDAATPPRYAALVEQVRTGPPRWSPVAWLGDAGNLLELFVHTEDVRRGGADGPEVPARPRDRAHEEALWKRLGQMARLLYRGCPVGLVLADRTGRSVRAVAPPAGQGVVVLRGALDDLLLHGFGRTGVARVRPEGTDEAVAALEGFRPR